MALNYPNISTVSDNNYIVLGITAVCGLFLIIIIYYIVVSRSDNLPEFKSLYNMNMPPAQLQQASNKQGIWNFGNSDNQNLQQGNGSYNGSGYNNSSVPMPANGALSDMIAAPASITITTAPSPTQPKVPEVFNVKANVYSFDDAPAVCGALNSDVATIEQLITAHQNGADWCNVGWTKDGLAGYPTQLSTWQIFQNSPGQQSSCGKPGVNLVRNDPNLLYGVNCYGAKPDPVGSEKVRTGIISEAQAALNAKIAALQNNGHIGLTSFNSDTWSES